MTNTNKNLSTWLGSVKDVMIHASIDGLNERNKYIRYPCDWDSVLKSLQFYKSIISQHRSAHLSFAPAIQLLNIDQLAELCEFFIDNFVTERCCIAWVSQVRYPVICDYSILPIDYRHKVAEILESKIETITHQHTCNKILSHANDLRNEIYTDEQKISYQKMFIRYNDQQDKFRKTQSWRSLLPDLEHSLTKSTK